MGRRRRKSPRKASGWRRYLQLRLREARWSPRPRIRAA